MGTPLPTDRGRGMPDGRSEGLAHPRRAGRIERLRHVRDDQRGAAILTVITLITVGLAVGGVAVVASTTAMQGSVRDESSKDALAAADAGVQAALMRQNQVAVSDSNPCVVLSAGTLAAGAAGEGGWCPPQQGSAGDATYEYRVRPAVETGLISKIEAVSTGTASGVSRRIHVTAETPRADAVFANHSVIGKDGITLNSNAQIYGSTGTNGNVTIGSNADVCGALQYGGSLSPPAYNGPPPPGCPPTYPFSKGPGSVSLPPVDQGNVTDPAHNDNDRIDPSNPNAPDTIGGSRSDVTFVDRMLTVTSGSTLTLGGQDYSFCRLVIDSAASLIVAAGAKVRIFFDAPENCPGLGVGPQILLESNANLLVTDGLPASLQLLVVGSSNPAITSDDVEFDSNSASTMPVIVYAPQSAVTLNSNSNLLGAVAGQSLNLDSNATITAHADGAGLELPVPMHYKQTRFVECSSTSAPPTAPSSSC
jgi:hypothetical protein